MKGPLWMITIPLALSVLSGALEWPLTDTEYGLLGLAMIGGTIWAWVVESKNN